MSLIAKSEGNMSIEKLEAGVYTAISSGIIDLGIQRSEKFNNSTRKFRLVWDILGEEIEINGEKMPRTMSKEYSLSLGEKSNLRKDLQAWRGKAFTEEELSGFNLVDILNVGCQLQILNEEKNGKTYNNIAGIMSLPKGSSIEKLDKTMIFDIETVETWGEWSNIPKWIQDTIKKAENYESTGLKKYVEEFESTQKTVEENNDVIKAEDDDLLF